MRYLIIILSCFLSVFSLQSQDVGLVAYYSFDACDATDDTGNGADGVLNGAPDCDCGVVNNALILDGVDDFVQFLGDFNVLFSDDFSVSMYFRPSEQTSGTIYDVLSKRDDCSLDTAFSVRLLNGGTRINAELAESPANSTFSNHDLDPRKCWHHLVFVRKIDESRLYYNGVQVTSTFAGLQLDVNNDGVFSIADSPCLNNGERRFAGAIDELRLYNRALATDEVEQLYQPIDEILINSTIIFKGDPYQVSIEKTCATNVNWTPTLGVSDPTILNPELMPESTMTYQVNLEYVGCTAVDTILLTVVDSAEFTCEKVFLPTAFTPNNDNLNETFGISNVIFLGELQTFQIFDRFGGNVFETNNPAERWDGTFNGDLALPGMYIYKIRFICDGEDKFKNGSFTLIR